MFGVRNGPILNLSFISLVMWASYIALAVSFISHVTGMLGVLSAFRCDVCLKQVMRGNEQRHPLTPLLEIHKTLLTVGSWDFLCPGWGFSLLTSRLSSSVHGWLFLSFNSPLKCLLLKEGFPATLVRFAVTVTLPVYLLHNASITWNHLDYAFTSHLSSLFS